MFTATGWLDGCQVHLTGADGDQDAIIATFRMVGTLESWLRSGRVAGDPG
jgi:hypothetical protein